MSSVANTPGARPQRRRASSLARPAPIIKHNKPSGPVGLMEAELRIFDDLLLSKRFRGGVDRGEESEGDRSGAGSYASSASPRSERRMILSQKNTKLSAERLSSLSPRRERIEKIAKEVEKENKSEFRFKPQLSPKVRQERLKKLELKRKEAEKRRKEEESRDAIIPDGPEEKELFLLDEPHYMVSYPSRPPPPEMDTTHLKLTPRARQMKRNVADLFNWEQSRLQKANTIRQEVPSINDSAFFLLSPDEVEEKKKELERLAREQRKSSYPPPTMVVEENKLRKVCTFRPKVARKSAEIVYQMSDRRITAEEHAMMTATASQRENLQRRADRLRHGLKDMKIAHRDPEKDPSKEKAKKRVAAAQQRFATDMSWWTEQIRSDTAYRKNRPVEHVEV